MPERSSKFPARRLRTRLVKSGKMRIFIIEKFYVRKRKKEFYLDYHKE